MATAGHRKKFHTGAHWGLFSAEVEDGRLVGVTPFEKDSNPSPIIETLPSAVHAECRIERPMVRKGWLERGAASDGAGRGVEPFVAVSWDRALDLLAAELARVKSEHGNQAIYAASGWSSAGRFHAAESQLRRFMNKFGGHVSQVTNYSFGAASVIVPRIVGGMESVSGPITSWPTLAEHTKLMVAFGGLAPKNAQVNKDGVGDHDTGDWHRKMRARGVTFVNISPLRDDMAAELDAEWLAIRPNTDVALMLALMHTLLTEGLHDAAFLERYCTGFDRFSAYLTGSADGTPKSADWAAPITEIAAGDIAALARRMAAARTMISMSWSVQRADHGEQPCWAAITLAAMLGQIGLPGGGFGIGYAANGRRGSPRANLPLPTLPRGPNAVDAVIPAARISDMLLNPGASYDFDGRSLIYPDIRLIYWCGGNPFHKQQDINRLLTAWQRPETIVIHEPWWTAAARRADIVLPCATTLERNDIGAAISDRFWFAMQKAIDPVGDSRTDYEIYASLADRLGFAEAFTEGRDENDWLRHLYNVARQQAAKRGHELPDFETFWETGHVEFPEPDDPPVLFAGFREDPVANPLRTPSGKIEIFSETIAGFGYDDCPGHPTWLEPAEWLGAGAAVDYPLHMLSNQPRTRLHSQLDCGTVSRDAKIAGREPITINPEDAVARGIKDGDVVRVHNTRGACLAGARLSDAVRPGVVVLSTGAWYDPLDAGEAGSLDRHGNPNVLTRDAGSSKLAQSCAAQTVLVEIERYDGDPPAITVFTQPEMAEFGEIP